MLTISQLINPYYLAEKILLLMEVEGKDAMSTAEICEKLQPDFDPIPLNGKLIAILLEPLRVRPTRIRINGVRSRGYRRRPFVRVIRNGGNTMAKIPDKPKQLTREQRLGRG